MAWNGAQAGAAAYQPPPYANGQHAYQQQPYGQSQYPQQQCGQQPPYGQPPYQQPQYGAQPQYPQSGPPQQDQHSHRQPKKKGNPVITRYPPPPGYRPPVPGHPSYGPQSQYPQQQHGYQAPAQNGYQSGYQQPGYQQNQTYPSQQAYPSQSAPYQPPQNYQQSYQQPSTTYPQSYPQQGYPPNQGGYPQPPNNYQQGYPPQQGSYQGYPQQPDPSVPYSQPPQQWQQPAQQQGYPPNDQYGSYAQPPHAQDPNATPVQASIQPSTTQSTPTQSQPASAVSQNGEQTNGQKPELYLAWDDWDFDFDGAIWPKGNEPIDPNLSLGVIIWRPAKQVTRALPATYEEAEEQALKPPAEKLGNGESVSIYFALDNTYAYMLDIRQTDYWDEIREDPIFVEFPDEKDMEYIPIADVIRERDRPDWPIEEEVPKDEDTRMEDSSWNVMDNLEQALSGQENRPENDDSNNRQHAQPKAPLDQSQEDILTQLGVTGAPKPVTSDPSYPPYPPKDEEETILAKLQQKPQPAQQPRHIPTTNPPRSNSYGGPRSGDYGPPPPQRPYGSMSTHSRPLPPPAPKGSPPVDQWRSDPFQNRPNGQPTYDGTRESPARSEGSNRTLAGSDFEMETEKLTPTKETEKAVPPQPQLRRSESGSLSRKRSYDEADNDDEKLRQDNDQPRRNKRRPPQVAAAYGRR